MKDDEYYSLLQEKQDLKLKIERYKCIAHFYFGYAKGIARGLPEPARSRALKSLDEEFQNLEGEGICQSQSKTSEDSNQENSKP